MPLARYNFNIVYKQDGKNGNFDGNFEVIERDGERSDILGSGIDRQASPTTRQREIRGRIIQGRKQSKIIFVVNVPITDENICDDVLYQFDENVRDSENYEGTWMPVRKIELDRVMRGPHESFSGIDYYISKFIEIIPNKKDRTAQPAKMKLHRIDSLVNVF